ncbi:hypothetical protein LX64_01158 [Chitinophaga skermanii]|uniref:Uncharacterized protein n=1 Tax=Chitinophaga skermanii TaxID=331697 RepID=A0A327QX15_9BACT|nr:hypothetical protein [Chitinophaga skermanii]RAJ08505.1 hypothetical protein LX64_01158 [Chitinophaga skermanii]
MQNYRATFWALFKIINGCWLFAWTLFFGLLFYKDQVVRELYFLLPVGFAFVFVLNTLFVAIASYFINYSVKDIRTTLFLHILFVLAIGFFNINPDNIVSISGSMLEVTYLVTELLLAISLTYLLPKAQRKIYDSTEDNLPL